jgi:ribosomal protein S18 acetylase RimI-like enzyme
MLSLSSSCLANEFIIPLIPHVVGRKSWAVPFFMKRNRQRNDELSQGILYCNKLGFIPTRIKYKHSSNNMLNNNCSKINFSTNHKVKESNTIMYTTNKEYNNDCFNIREAEMNDLGRISTIVTDGFFSDCNMFKYQIEKLKTFLSLEDCFPRHETNKHKYLVACDKKNKEKVIGFVEIDCRSSLKKTNKRPYMCNLSIDTKWKRKGVATALISSCEECALSNNAKNIWLKVRAGNVAAITMYTKLGYEIDSSDTAEEVASKKETVILLMKKDVTTSI